MAFQISPGVSVSEIDLTTRTPIPSISDGAFAGNFNWGPAEQVTFVTSQDELVSYFGKPDETTYKSVLTASSFLSYSNKLRIVRSINSSSGLNSTTVGTGTFIKNDFEYDKNYKNKTDGTAAFYAKYPGILGDSLKISMCLPDRANTVVNNFDEVELAGNTDIVLTGTFDNAGVSGNVAIEATDGSTTKVDFELRVGDVITYTNGDGDLQKAIVTSLTNSTYFTAETSSGQAIDGDNSLSAATIVRKKRSNFSEPPENMMGTIEIFESDLTTVVGSGTYFTLQVKAGDLLSFTDNLGIYEERRVESVSNNTSLVLSTPSARPVNELSEYSRNWEYNDNFPNPPLTSRFAYNRTGNKDVNDEIHIIIVDEDGLITNKKDKRGGGPLSVDSTIEVFPNLSVANNALGLSTGETLYYKDVINARSKWVRWGSHDAIGNQVQVNSVDITATGWGVDIETANSTFAFSGSFSSTSAANGSVTYSFGGGHDGQNTSDADKITAYELLKDVENVDAGLILTGETSNTLATYLISDFAEYRKDCVVFVSPEESIINKDDTQKVNDIIVRRNVLPSSSYAVMDGNYKYMFDRFNGVYRWVPFNGDIAGLCSQSDNFNPFISPAGFNRGNLKNVDKLAFNPSRPLRDLLYVRGVNPIVSFPGRGKVLYGDKTLLAKPSAFDRINVRRLFIAVEKAIAQAAQFSLFEFNDAFTRAQFVALVDPFLRRVQSRRGISDYRVICDETNNPPALIDNNEFRGDIFIKPTKSINFIQLNFVAVSSGVEFSEIVDAI
jgi:hypothetical protein